MTMKHTVALAALFIFTLFVPMTQAQQPKVTSILESYDLATGQRSTLREFPYLIESPNWTPDGKWIIYNADGKLYKVPVQGDDAPQQINTDFATSCNNDHVLSADGKQIAISHGTAEDHSSRIYTLPITGGTPQLITPMAPSYLHGWSPDLAELAYCAERGGNYDIYVVPATGGVERRLTTAEGLDDGPEYSPCGNYIWFNSVRTGTMQAWRMRRDGSEQTQMTFGTNRYAWFPHVSPDGKWVSYIAYRKGDLEPGEHLANKQVEIYLMPAVGGTPRRIVELFGGQGSLNVNTWSPDSRRFAFISYRLEP